MTDFDCCWHAATDAASANSARFTTVFFCVFSNRYKQFITPCHSMCRYRYIIRRTITPPHKCLGFVRAGQRPFKTACTTSARPAGRDVAAPSGNIDRNRAGAKKQDMRGGTQKRQSGTFAACSGEKKSETESVWATILNPSANVLLWSALLGHPDHYLFARAGLRFFARDYYRAEPVAPGAAGAEYSA